jgi:hypothetical protein
MRVCYFYAESFPRAVRALPPGAELVDTSGSDTAYWEALSARWNKGDDLVTIEQDNLIDDQVIASFEACTEPWCSYAYILGPVIKNLITELVVPWGILRAPVKASLPVAAQVGVQKPVFEVELPTANIPQCWNSMGCTRFSAEMQEKVPLADAVKFADKHCARCTRLAGKSLCWAHIDGPVNRMFNLSGFTEAHVHGEVEHLHFKGLDARMLFLCSNFC